MCECECECVSVTDVLFLCVIVGNFIICKNPNVFRQFVVVGVCMCE